ncbi:MAG: arginyltransferase [Robiginitomaculum sp.]|nr:arginyltransferase [Robiginitomaculum sp.]
MTYPLNPKQLQFFLTAPAPCPYLPDREETKLFTYLAKSDGRELNDMLTSIGFRRAQNISYRPACASCNACKSCRIVTADYQPSRSQKRITRKNQNLIRSVKPAIADEEHYALISKYLCARHISGGMEGMDEDDFAELIEETSVATELVDYRNEQDELIASALIDQLSDGASMVYSFFNPEFAGRSLGKFMIIDHINRAKSSKQPYLYLGFWVQKSQKMNYKDQFTPLQILQGNNWETLGDQHYEED